MTLRLCLRIGLMSPWPVFAFPNARTSEPVQEYQHLYLPICSLHIQILPHPIPPSTAHQAGRDLVIVQVSSQQETQQNTSLFEAAKNTPPKPSTGTATLSAIAVPSSLQLRDRKAPSDSRMMELTESLRNGHFFRQGESALLQMLKRVFAKELEYLKSSGAASYPGRNAPKSPSPSQVLYASESHSEINRTLNGILALYWIHNDDYHAFTNNQDDDCKLTERSFGKLRQFYRNSLNNWKDTDGLFTLIVLQMINDVGKSSSLQAKLSAHLPRGQRVSPNHDMVMYQVLSHASQLIPSYHSLPRTWQERVPSLIKLSAVFNPGQFVQAECTPAALNGLTELAGGEKDLDMKFMEMFLDLCGAAGHVNHEGARSMTEPTFQGYMKARDLSQQVAGRIMDLEQAYDQMLQFRLHLVTGRPQMDTMLGDPTEYAVARLYCMGRQWKPGDAKIHLAAFKTLHPSISQKLIRGLNAPCAEIIDEEGKIQEAGEKIVRGVQPVYMPGMLALVDEPFKQEKLTALFEYLADILYVNFNDLTKHERQLWTQRPDLNIVERDVRCLEQVLKSSDAKSDLLSFQKLLQDVPIPKAEVLHGVE